MGHVVVRHAVLVADAVLDNGVGRADTLEEIPSVIGVVPRAATDIVVSCTGELLVGKAIGVTTEISGTAGHRLVVEVIVGVHIEDDIVSAFLHLTSRIGRPVYIEVLKEAVRAFVIEVVLAGPCNRKIFDMDVQRVGVHGDTACAVRHLMKIQNRFLSRVSGDDDAFGGRALFVDGELIRELICAAQEIKGVAGECDLGYACSKRGRRGVGRAIAGAVRRSKIRSCLQRDAACQKNEDEESFHDMK